MRNFLSYLIVIGGVLFFSSCEKVAFDPPKIEGQVSFKTTVAPSLDKYCGSCHYHSTVLKTQPDFYKKLAQKAFIDTVNAASSKILTKLQANPLHQGNSTPPDSLAKIFKWFEQGAKNN
jgi:hypothetical protein